MFTLRPAHHKEKWIIRRLIWQVGINPLGLDWRRFWVAVNEKDELLGCIQLKPHGADIWEMASLAVRPGERGRGVAAVLIKKALTLKSLPIYLMCRRDLVPFYEKFGFKEILDRQDLPKHFQKVQLLSAWGKRVLSSWKGVAVMINSA